SVFALPAITHADVVPTAQRVTHACSAPAVGYAACFAQVVVSTTTGIQPQAATPTGLNPADLRTAYHLTTTGSPTQTIAIVDAQDDPTAERDLATYRSTFGLPACTTANGCFRKVDQRGGTSFPAVDA